MRLEQLEVGSVEAVRLVVDLDALPAEFARGTELALVRPDGEDDVLVRAGRVVAAVRGATRRDRERVDAICATGLPQIAWVLQADGARRELLIQIHTFAGRLQGALSLALDERALDDAARVSGLRRSMRAVQEWLADECLLPARAGDESGVRERAFLGAGTGRGLDDAFTVHGRTLRLEVRQVSGDGHHRHVVTRVVRGRGRGDPGRLFLAEGTITFIDSSVAAMPRTDIQAQLAQLGVESGGVIDLWKRWHVTEAESILQRARAFGVIPYVRVEATADHRQGFVIAEAGHARLVGSLKDEELESAVVAPPILANPGVSWVEYEQQASVGRPFVGKVVRIERREGLLILKRTVGGDQPPPEGVLFASVLGDRTRLRRQREAAEAIGTGTNPMRHLGPLIEDLDAPPSRSGTLKLGRAARRKVFGAHGPTAKQEAAIRMALNTPDVALIQGPPGTGKTTVINALVEQLNELADSSDGVDQILLSGFQHDAVENAIARMSVNGLPAIKFGGRSGGIDEEDATEAEIDRWCQERAEVLRTKVSPRTPSALARAIERMVEGYLLAPLPRAATAELLGRIAGQVCGQIPTALMERLRRLERELAAAADACGSDQVELVRRIRALRTTATSFVDDGAITARRLLQLLTVQPDGEVAADVCALLERAAAWRGAGAPPFVDELATARRRLLRAHAADLFPDAQPRLREDVALVLTAVRDALSTQPVGSQDAIEEAAAELLAAYEGDPDLVRRSILAYMAVAGATCQQSKRLFTGERGEEPYQTVIVDEAARANPLDLFIPIAQAARRIVLVGDHRQLPHVLDRQLELELEWALRKDASPAVERTKELLGRSLFQQLFENLARRQGRGEGMRVITLDEQYRMHPALGDFVSREFYAPHGEGFRSPLPAAAFAHDLPGYPGPAFWLDVGRGAYGTEEPGQSKSRPWEATLIARELRRLIDSPGGVELNFGIITFYSAQVDAINAAFREVGLVDEHDRVVEAYRDLVRPGRKRVDRLKIGSVDAFQGMEFDVVFLSMVRCNELPDHDELERRRKYGHLMSPNRLCVSMSRQQRLLVVAGDPAMLREPNAGVAIGPLIRFHALTRELAGAVR